ncbi:MAG TPA: hypothetical protein VMX97_04910 [Hyphomicrobiaceae bacterium]|nr:hypothetical protein [Hyphomicrobiaceae bacterium]
MNQFNKNRVPVIPPNGKLYAALFLSDMLNPPIGGRGSVDFQPDSFITRNGHRADMEIHADSGFRAPAEAARMVKPCNALIKPFVRVTALVGLAVTFAGFAYIF